MKTQSSKRRIFAATSKIEQPASLSGSILVSSRSESTPTPVTVNGTPRQPGADNFIHSGNPALFRKRLAEAADDVTRQILLKLLLFGGHHMPRSMQVRPLIQITSPMSWIGAVVASIVLWWFLIWSVWQVSVDLF
jgi:hypothetical protein